MNLPIKPVCERRFIRKDGTSLIYIQYCYSAEKRTLLNTKISIPPEFWNQKKGCISEKLPAEFGIVQEINGDLRRMQRIAEDIIIYGIKQKVSDIGDFVKRTFKLGLEISSLEHSGANDKQGNNINIDIYNQIDDYIKSKEKKVCKDMPRIYRNMKEHLKAFEAYRGEPITFDCLDLDFYEEFVDFLTYDYILKRRKDLTTGLKINTIGKTIKQFRTFLRNRIRKRIIPPIDMDGWTILEEEVDAVYLSMEEINSIYHLDLSNYPHLINYRNEFKVLLLNRANKVLGVCEVSSGGITGTVADPRLIFVAALKANCCAIVKTIIIH